MNQKLKKALSQYGAIFEERQNLIPATIGTDDTFGQVEVPNKTNYVYVRIQSGEIAQAYNTKVTPLAGLKVWCGYEKTRPGLLQVLDVRNIYGKEYQQKIPAHAPTHEFGGYDQMYVRGEQFIPKLVSKYSGMTVRVQAGAIYTDDWGWYWHRPQEIDLTSYVPITGAHWALLEVGYSGTINVKVGSAVASKYVLHENTIPAPSNNAQPIAAVAMYQSQSGISASKYGGNDILDLRWYQSIKTGTAGGGGIAEAPLTGLTYGRNSGTWVEVSGTGGGTTLITGSLSMDLKIDQTSGTTGYGILKGNQDSSNLFYTVSQDQYMSGRLLVFLNGQALSQGIDWSEQYPSSGTFYFISGSAIPTSTDIITAEYLLTSGSLPTWSDAPADGLQYGRQSGSWTVITGSGASGIAEAPLDGLQYARQSGTWKHVTGSNYVFAGNSVVPETSYGLTVITGSSSLYSRADHSHGSPPSGVLEAPLDGLQYGRQSGSWTVVTGSTSPATYVLSGTNYNMPASVGTATEYARADHQHGTPPSGTGGGISDAPSDSLVYARFNGAWLSLSGSKPYEILCYVGDGSNVITSGTGGFVEIPVTSTLKSIRIVSNNLGVSGTATIDLWKTTYAGHPGTVANTIISGSSNKPVVTNDFKSEKTSFAGFLDTVWSRGDWLRVQAENVVSFKQVVVSIGLEVSGTYY